MSSLTPVLAELLEAAVEGKTRNLRVALPGRIEAYNKSIRRATIQATVQDGFVDGDGERQTITIPQMTDVPVMRVGSGSERYRYPISAGDPCTLVFSSSSIARIKSGDGGDVVDPADDRRHHEADAIALPGLFLSGSDRGAAPTYVEIDDQEILHLGTAPAPHFSLLGEPFLSAFATLVGAIGTAVGSSGTPAGATTAAASIATALLTFQGQVTTYLSQKVKLV